MRIRLFDGGAGVVAVAAIFALFGFLSAQKEAVKPKACNCPKPRPETCEQKAARLQPISNSIESTIVVSFGARKSCFLPERLPIKIAVGEQLSINVRHVYNDALFVPLSGRALQFSVVDSFGFPSPAREVSVRSAKTRFDGFPDEDVTFASTELGVFRVRIDYLDRETPNFVLTPVIIVIDPAAEAGVAG